MIAIVLGDESSDKAAFAIAIPEKSAPAISLPRPESLRWADDFEVPLSDFSRVLPMRLDIAVSRADEGDPRHTPLLDALWSRFEARGPDGEPWRLMYAKGVKQSDLARYLGAIEASGVSWAGSAVSGKPSSWLFTLPVAALAVWLLIRRSRSGVRVKLAFSAAAAFPVSSLSLGGALVGVAMIALGALAALESAGKDVRERAFRLAPAALPFAIIAAVAMAFDPSLIIRFVAAIAFISVAWAGVGGFTLKSHRLHPSPAFVAISPRTVHAETRSLFAPAAIAAAAALSLSAISRGSNDSIRIPYGAAYVISFPRKGGDRDASAMVKAHVAFQEALTYGRLGEAEWGSMKFSPAYRYEETGDTLKRAENAPPISPKAANLGSESFDERALVTLLEVPGPAKIVAIKP